MRVLLALALGLAACGARADVPDLKTYTCEAYLRFVMSNMTAESDARAKTAVGFQMAWIYGYVSGAHQATLMDAERFRQVMHDLGNRCQAHPDALVLAQAEEAWAHPAPPASPVPAK